MTDAFSYLEKYDSCCFTGHRVLPKSEEARKILRDKLRRIIADLVKEGITRFYTGGARGFDAMAAMTVLEMKAYFPQIQLYLAIPFLGQHLRWPKREIALYEQIMEHADKVEVISPSCTRDCMKKRNYYMVDHSCICVYYMVNQVRSGTAQTVSYAKKRHSRLIDLAEEIDSEFMSEREEEQLSYIEKIYFEEKVCVREFFEEKEKQML